MDHAAGPTAARGRGPGRLLKHPERRAPGDRTICAVGPEAGVLRRRRRPRRTGSRTRPRSEEHTSELQSRGHLVCRLLLEKKKPKRNSATSNKPTTRQVKQKYIH